MASQTPGVNIGHCLTWASIKTRGLFASPLQQTSTEAVARGAVAALGTERVSCCRELTG
jgi:hypothetical protein